MNRFGVFFYLMLLGFATTISVTRAESFAPDALNISVLQDTQTELAFTDVVAREDWQPIKKNFFAGGYSRKVRWLKLTFEMPAQETLLLTLLMGILDDVRLYVPEILVNPQTRIAPHESGVVGWRYFQQGDTFRFAQRELNWRGFSFSLQIPQQKSYNVYLRLFSNSSHLVVPRLWTNEQFHAYQKKEMLITGFFAGILILFTFISGLVCFFVREKLQVAYFLFLALSVGYVLGLNGFIGQYFFANYPQVASNLVSVIVATHYSAMCYFHIQFLFKHIRGTIIYYLQYVMFFFGLIVAVFAAISQYGVINSMFHALILLLILINIIAIIRFYNKRRLPKNLFIVYMALSILAIITTTGFLGSSLNTAFLSLYGSQINLLVTTSVLLLFLFNETHKQINTHTRSLALADSQAKAFESQRYWLAMLTHEIKTPVSVINASCDSIKLLTIDAAVLKRLAKIKRSTERIDNLVKRFLRNDEIQVRLQNLQHVSIDLKTWISQQLQFFDETAQQRLQLKIYADVVVTADANLLSIALTNLLTNALKYSKDSRIEIEIKEAKRSNQNGILFSVRDFGTPITQEKRARLYQRHEMTGSNVGLWACREIARAHNGEVWLDNNQDFNGNVFNIWLPK